MPLRVLLANSPSHIADAERLRFKVYCEEERLLPARSFADERESDARDRCPRTTHVLAYMGSEAVGTVRLIRSQGCPSSGKVDLPLEARFALRGFERPGLVVAEVTRYCVLRKFRGTRVVADLFEALLVASLRRGVTHWVAAANMETDSDEDAAIAHRLVSAQGLLSETFRAEARAVSQPPSIVQRPLYTAEQRSRARRGELAGLKAPPILSLFARRMGARYLGPPAFDDHFNVFALPLVAALSEVTRTSSADTPFSTEAKLSA